VVKDDDLLPQRRSPVATAVRIRYISHLQLTQSSSSSPFYLAPAQKHDVHVRTSSSNCLQHPISLFMKKIFARYETVSIFYDRPDKIPAGSTFQ
jgi:hypothetical protein